MLEVHKISKSYYHKSILNDISFQVKTGDIVGIYGKNGVGKTTLLKILCGLITADRGKVIINSLEIDKFDPRSRKNSFYLGHEPCFYSIYSCKENLVFCASLYNTTKTDSEINSIIKSVGLENNDNKIIQFFSQGMLQRLKIAAAEIIPWKILFFDEPFNGLDKKGIKILESYIESWSIKGKTMVFVCHDIKWIKQNCNKILSWKIK